MKTFTTAELRELDAWIAEHVMEWRLIKSRQRGTTKCFKDSIASNYWFVGFERQAEAYECDHPEDEMFHPTTDHAASDMLDDKILEKSGHCECGQMPDYFYYRNGKVGIITHPDKKICRALFAKKLFTK